nr:hypothetical protein [uncultured Prevotella sp.]
MKVYMNLTTVPDSGIILRKEGAMLRLFFDFTEMTASATSSDETTSDETTADKQYSCENVDMTGERTYSAIVAAIVNASYTSNDVQSILANYTLASDTTSSITDEKRTEYKTEYDAFQSLRAHAKEIAAKAVELLG